MSLTKLGRLCVVLTSISISAWAVGCGSPASNSANKPAESLIPEGEQPAEAGSTTGGAGAEVPEGGEEPKKEGGEEPKKEKSGS
ncbi:MAG: hypothetical protein K0U86_13745 [Planctomycetes bacterium]|nr:hypothetical protein [Planctomycetota bacterium]MCH9725956.1 hypothetical protein [Planctomycetota bacterium]MCH9777109.1 hypothetical protein [Planctomycetota bacterium]MCH9789168.1 hypothetical protein [Planctomycetota bacterium]MDF1746829.1 hypothetical protein [Gimesia sp.]